MNASGALSISPSSSGDDGTAEAYRFASATDKSLVPLMGLPSMAKSALIRQRSPSTHAEKLMDLHTDLPIAF
jgi:hypothetical protein